VSKELEWKTGLAFNDFMIHPPPREPGGNRWLVAFLLAAVAVVAPAGAQEVAAPGAVAKYGFNTADALTGWIVAGDAGIDLTKDRQSAGGSLKIGPGGSALLKLRAEDGSGKVEQRMIEVDRAIGDRWLVASGLAPGDRVIVEGIQKVRPGVSVKPIPFNPGGKGSPEAAKAGQPTTGAK